MLDVLPSLALYRLPNTPDPEDAKPGALCCSECGSQSVYGEYLNDTLCAACHDCEEVWPVSLADLAPFQYPDPYTILRRRTAEDDL